MSLSKNVLIADEDPLLGASICAELAGLGYSCSFCRFYSHIEKHVAGHKPELIIINVNRFEDSCIDALKQLSALNYQSSIFIISDVDAPIVNTVANSAAMFDLNIAGTLKKPFSLSTLTHKICALENDKSGNFKNNLPLTKVPTPKWPADEILKKALQTAIGNEIHVAYQPQMDLCSGVLTGVEALARWDSNVYGRVPPSVFIPLAEKYNLISALTNAVTRISLSWLHEFLASCSALPPGTVCNQFRLSLNVSPKCLQDNTFADRLDEMLTTFHLSRKNIVLEVTETSSLTEYSHAYEVLTRLRLRGYHLAIDDIGTGYASLQQLIRLPFSEVKIDRCFIISALTSYESAVITRSIINMAHALSLRVTAEGIENEETLNFVKESGCDTGQGYFFARPMRAGELPEWLDKHARRANQSRLATLDTLSVGRGSKTKGEIDRLTRLSSRIFSTPVSAVSVLDDQYCHIVSGVGIGTGRIPLEDSVCRKLLPDRSMFYISDLKEELTDQVPLLTTDQIALRFYVSHALRASNGCIVGSFILADTGPGNLTPAIINGLPIMAAIMEKELFYPRLRLRSAYHLHKLEKRFLQRADALILLAESMSLSFQLLQIKLLSSDDSSLNAVRTLRTLCRQHFKHADLLMQTKHDEINLAFVGREKKWVLNALIQFELKLKEFEKSNAIINCLKVTHYYPPANFGDTLQHIFCCREASRESLIFIRADK